MSYEGLSKNIDNFEILKLLNFNKPYIFSQFDDTRLMMFSLANPVFVNSLQSLPVIRKAMGQPYMCK